MKLETRLTEGVPCAGCRSMERFPKYNCRECKYAYSSHFKSVRSSSPRQQSIANNKARRAISDKDLQRVYGRIKELYFGGNYIPDPNVVMFTWKRGKYTTGGWCSKHRKEIKIGGVYRYVFYGQPDERAAAIIERISGGNLRKRLVELMVHEAVHLRLAHHRKNFRTRVEEIHARITDTDVERIYSKELIW